MVPENIFTALSEGETLKVLVFSIIFGVTLGLIQEPITRPVFEGLESVYKAFNRIIHWMTYMLPLGLCSLLAHQLSQLGLDVIFSMLNFILVAIATFMVIYIISTLAIWYKAKVSLLKVLSAIREPSILALATSSSLACLPSAIASLHEELKFESQATSLVAPLSITIGRFGSVIYFTLASVFVAQLYNTELGLPGLSIIIVGSIFAGMATSGVTGILTLTMMGLVLEPLKLPLEAVLVLFIAVDPIMDPFRTLGIVHTGMATTALVADLES
jgi:Na+/H+-dicarboxylate symporter